MELTTSHIQFIKDHATDDLTRLLLSAAKYPGMDIPFLVDQIAVRRQIREKLPSWFENGQLVFPAKIAAEQCSSEQTAAYKQELIGESWTICDLTGGLGIDSYFLSRKAKHLTYIERFPVYCEAAKHNFSVLEANNITIINADAAQVVDTLPEVDAFYIDPARRGESNKRVFALQDCEPNLPGLLPALLKRSPHVIAKLSPMADIQMTLELLPGTTSVHVLSVRNECKELLFVVERYRARGIGRSLVDFWEKAMLERHHRVLLTSTLSSETSQHFYRKLGYTDIGGFTLPGEPLELLLMKTFDL